jgi:hypothetical protein
MTVTCRRPVATAPRSIAVNFARVIRITPWVTLVMGLVIADGGSARAQRIDEYLNPAIPGFDVAPGVTVTSRLRPEYEYQGLRLGAFIFHSEVIESAGYETNVTATQPPHGSAFLDTAATLQAVSDWGSDSLGAAVSVDNNLYFDQPRQTDTNWTASIGGSHDFGPNTAYIGYAHLNLNQTPSDLGVPQLDSPIAYRIDTVRLTYKAVFGQGKITPGIEVTNFSYDNGTVQGQPYIQTYRNRVVIAPSMIASYDFDALRTVLGVVRYANAQYTEPEQGAATRNFNDISVLGGVNYDTGALVRLRLLLGYESRFFQSAQYKTIAAPIVEGSAVWTPTGLTTVTGTIARYIQESANENTVGYIESVLKVSVDHEFLPNVLFNASAAAVRDVYSQSEGQQTFYSIGGGVTWMLNTQLRLGLRYDFSNRQSPGGSDTGGGLSNTQIFGGTYSDNRILLQLRIGL